MGELLQILNGAVSRASSSTRELTPDHIELRETSIVEDVKAMAQKEQEREVVQFLHDVVRRQGFEIRKRGAPLQSRMAELLGVSVQSAGRLIQKHITGQ